MTGKLAVFDVDGTLVDSRAILKRAADAAFEALGVTAPRYDELRQIVGLSLREGLAQLSPGLTEAQVDTLMAHYRQTFTALRREPGFTEPLYPGAADLLAGLKARGWRIAMATGKSRKGVEAIVEMHGWADLFDSLHCADDGPGKPHPAMLIAAMDALGFAPGRTIMVGDTAHDVHMAHAAAVPVVAVSWGFHTRAELEASAAGCIVDSFPELQAELDRFAEA